VGFVEAAQGTAQLLAAIPAGVLADKIARTKVLKVSGCLGFAAAAVLIIGILMDSLPAMFVALSLWGLYRGTWDPPLKALFADSMELGSRSKYFTYMYVITILSSASGPIVNLVLFQVLGNAWTRDQLSRGFIIGVAMGFIPNFLLLWFKDVDKVVENRESGDIQLGNTLEKASPLIPWIIAFNDLVFGIASGMTIKFFPLFFETECGFSPVKVSVIYIVAPFSTALMSLASQRAAGKIGRVGVTILCKSIGITLLFLMAFFPQYWKHYYVVVPIFIARTALMNGCYPLMRSIMMDCVSKESRARWNSFESITSFGWSGSAALGGVLADHVGFAMTFVITASLQAIGWLATFPLLPLVPEEKKAVEDKAAVEQSLLTATQDTTDMDEEIDVI